jgi:hypothetical protein
MPDTDRTIESSAPNFAGLMPLSPLWDMSTLMDIQARMWNQMLDSQRGWWALCMPWLQSSPWLQAGAEAIEAEEVGKEPAETTDGLPDPLELQARTWNHFLDANRSLWSSVMWPMPLADAGRSDTETPTGATREEPANEAPSRGHARSASSRSAKRNAPRKRA